MRLPSKFFTSLLLLHAFGVQFLRLWMLAVGDSFSDASTDAGPREAFLQSQYHNHLATSDAAPDAWAQINADPASRSFLHKRRSTPPCFIAPRRRLSACDPLACDAVRTVICEPTMAQAWSACSHFGTMNGVPACQDCVCKQPPGARKRKRLDGTEPKTPGTAASRTSPRLAKKRVKTSGAM